MNSFSTRTILLTLFAFVLAGNPLVARAAEPDADELKEAVRAHANLSTWTFGDKVGTLSKLDMSLEFIAATWVPSEESVNVSLHFRPSLLGASVLKADPAKPRPLWTYSGKWKCALGGVIGFRKWKIATLAGSYEAKQPFAGAAAAPPPK